MSECPYKRKHTEKRQRQRENLEWSGPKPMLLPAAPKWLLRGRAARCRGDEDQDFEDLDSKA